MFSHHTSSLLHFFTHYFSLEMETLMTSLARMCVTDATDKSAACDAVARCRETLMKACEGHVKTIYVLDADGPPEERAVHMVLVFQGFASVGFASAGASVEVRPLSEYVRVRILDIWCDKMDGQRVEVAVDDPKFNPVIKTLQKSIESMFV